MEAPLLSSEEVTGSGLSFTCIHLFTLGQHVVHLITGKLTE